MSDNSPTEATDQLTATKPSAVPTQKAAPAESKNSEDNSPTEAANTAASDPSPTSDAAPDAKQTDRLAATQPSAVPAEEAAPGQSETRNDKLPVPEVTEQTSVYGAFKQVYEKFTDRRNSPSLSHLPETFWSELEAAHSHLKDNSFGLRRAILNVLHFAGDARQYDDACYRPLEYLRTAMLNIETKSSALAASVIAELTKRRTATTQSATSSMAEQPQSIMQFFEFNHLQPPMKAVSSAFHDLAVQVVENIGQGPERTVALRKLLEAKDAAVRAVLHPGA